MLRVYINYPNPKFSVHTDHSCAHIQKSAKPNQREVSVDVQTISTELARFREKEYSFGAYPAANDMWLLIDFADQDFEMAVLRYIQRLIGKHYRPLRDATIETHC